MHFRGKSARLITEMLEADSGGNKNANFVEPYNAES